jgi:REP element-mobilizing transposase RayT
MPSPRIPKDLNDRIYFMTFTVKNWYYLFDRHYRWNILANSLKYCQASKGLKLYGFVFMLNHIHLVASSADVAGFVRDFKKYTSKELQKNILQTEPNILKLFLDENGRYEFWSKTNMPKIIETEKFLYQKMEYIHANPVRKNYVAQADHWYWSSANPNCEIKTANIWQS